MSAQREAFEAWARPLGFKLKRFEHLSDAYIAPPTRYGWNTWQAAQAAMLAECRMNKENFDRAIDAIGDELDTLVDNEISMEGEE